MNDKKSVPATRKQIDWVITLVPLAIISGMSVLFFAFPNKSKSVLTSIRYASEIDLGHDYLIHRSSDTLNFYLYGIFEIWRYRPRWAG